MRKSWGQKVLNDVHYVIWNCQWCFGSVAPRNSISAARSRQPLIPSLSLSVKPESRHNPHIINIYLRLYYAITAVTFDLGVYVITDASGKVGTAFATKLR